MTVASRKVLYISYNGMLDPLGQSQVIPYLKELSRRGVRFWLLSFERPSAFEPAGRDKMEQLRLELLRYGIEWHALRYHQKPSLPATVYDVAMGIRLASRLVRKHQIEMVHARSHIPAVIALRLKKRFGVKMIFDVRGLMAEEYIDAGHWKPRGIPARVTKTMEARAFRAADGIVTLTDALWEAMQNWPAQTDGQVAHETIPCCIDLTKFHFDAQQRAVRRSELGISERLVLVYSGSVGGWYMTNEMAAFFRSLTQANPRAFFLWLTHGAPAIVAEAMQSHGIAESDYAVKKVDPAEIPEYLNVADAGIAFYRPGISRLGTSPVKVSEYLAYGLPVIISSGIGDSDVLITREQAGALVNDFNEPEFAHAVRTIESMTASAPETRTRLREVSERLFDVQRLGAERYARLYERVMGN